MGLSSCVYLPPRHSAAASRDELKVGRVLLLDDLRQGLELELPTIGRRRVEPQLSPRRGWCRLGGARALAHRRRKAHLAWEMAQDDVRRCETMRDDGRDPGDDLGETSEIRVG